MGQNKALLKINGATLIETVIAAVPAEQDKIKIVTNSPEDFHFIPHIKIPDIFPQCGPISGIHAGLVDSSERYNFFLACDLPFLSQTVISEIINKHAGEPVFGVKTEKGFQPLCAIYSKSCLEIIEAMIDAQRYSLQDLLMKVNSGFIEMINRRDLFNLNTPEDWQFVQEIKAKRRSN